MIITKRSIVREHTNLQVTAQLVITIRKKSQMGDGRRHKVVCRHRAVTALKTTLDRL